ncbi:MAG: SCO family protein [Thermoanaerobaculia bacterium]|nr:SCO family protein [Thermoanaerobaculia bacterium]
MTRPPSRGSRAPFPKLALAGFLVLLALSVAVALTVAARPRAEIEPPPELARLPDFSLQDSSGRAVGRTDLLGKPWVAEMIFTRCPFSCPRMTERMRGLERGLERAGGARRVSISVDPEHDVPEVLARHRSSLGVRDPEWLFLTGGREEIAELVVGGFRLGLDTDPPDGAAEPILHSTRFVLVDGRGVIRGYYDAFQPGEVERLLRELAAVHREAEKAGPAGGVG